MKGRYSAKNTIKRQEIADRVLLIVIGDAKLNRKALMAGWDVILVFKSEKVEVKH